MATAEHRTLAHSGTSVFTRIVVGVDGREPGFEACRQARALLEPDGWIELACSVPPALLREAEARRATLLALGGPAATALHEAPCSVLVARAPQSGAFPGRIVVGIDGSPEADRALLVAQALAGRFDAALRVVAALDGKGVDLGWIHLRMPFADVVETAPVDALVEAAEEADLLVVGCRGLHGTGALGSVGEQVAHRAACSVLLVRGSRDPAV